MVRSRRGIHSLPNAQPEGSDQENEYNDENVTIETDTHLECQEQLVCEKQEVYKSEIRASISPEPSRKSQNEPDSVTNEQASSEMPRHNNFTTNMLASGKQEMFKSPCRVSVSPEPIRRNRKASVSVTKERMQSEIPMLINSTNNVPWKTLTFWIFLISVALVIIGIYFSKPRTCSFKEIKGQYPKENDFLWKKLEVGVELILNKNNKKKPAVYLFTHHGGQTAFQLINDTAVHCSKCFGKELVPMDRDDFISAPGSLDDYGYAIEKYKNKLKQGNVILVANLNEIPAKAARAFHTICDTHSPISDNAVIFLTLTVSADKLGNANSMAEETLQEIWGSELRLHELDPLITRVTDQVIILQS